MAAPDPSSPRPTSASPGHTASHHHVSKPHPHTTHHARARQNETQRTCSSWLSFSTDWANWRFLTVYSWPHHTWVSWGSCAQTSCRAWYICWAVPSKNRPHPPNPCVLYVCVMKLFYIGTRGEGVPMNSVSPLNSARGAWSLPARNYRGKHVLACVCVYVCVCACVRVCVCKRMYVPGRGQLCGRA
jgi:hypothetical protein